MIFLTVYDKDNGDIVFATTVCDADINVSDCIFIEVPEGKSLIGFDITTGSPIFE